MAVLPEVDAIAAVIVASVVRGSKVCPAIVAWRMDVV
jgi:hypothetical protein